ncbi:MAG: DUF4347 domain-containing protein, partial [Betaproteobacteria bacterium]|nr:DUF4347 domain-containing protein [Betaproteobacteria bacterium]
MTPAATQAAQDGAPTTDAQKGVVAAPASQIDPVTGRTITIDQASGDVVLGRLSSPSDPNAKNEIVFIDTSVQGYQSLLSGVKADAQIVLLDASRDGIQQMAAFMAGQQNVDAIHLLSHGNEGVLQIGTAQVDVASMATTYAQALQQIGQHLSSNADFLVYGCDFGQGLLGATASSELSVLTGANVASSVDLTGDASLGGNWTLERDVGQVHTDVVFDADSQAAFHGVLDTLDWDTQTWTAAWSTTTGSASQTYTLPSGTVTISLTLRDSTGNAVTGVNPWASGFPSDQQYDTGNLTPTQNALAMLINGNGFKAAGQYIDVQITFSQPGGVNNVAFNVFDIDNGGSGGFIDQVTLTAKNDTGATVNPTSIAADPRAGAAGGTSWTASGNVVTGSVSAANNTGTGAEIGTAFVSFAQSNITQINLHYTNVGALSAQQAISLGDISFQAPPSKPTVDLNTSDSSVSATDTFTTRTYTDASGGAIAWKDSSGNASSWVETDSGGGGATGGNVQVKDTAGFITSTGTYGDLQLNKDTSSIQRAINLSSYSTDNLVNLSFNYRADTSVTATSVLDAQVSTDGGTTWTTIGKVTPGTGGSGTATFDMTGYAGANTVIRFKPETGSFNAGNFYISDVAVTATPTGYAATYTEGGSAVSIAHSDASISDTATNMTAMTVTVGNFFAGDTLTWTNQAGITTTYNSSTGVLTATGTASRLNYESLLRSIQYSSTSQNPDNYGTDKTRSISVSVTDSSSNTSNVAHSTITVNAVDNAPTITSSTSASVPEGTSTSTVVYTATATDPDSPTVTFSLTGADASKFNINSATGQVTFKSVPAYGTQSVYNVTVNASDGTLTS